MTIAEVKGRALLRLHDAKKTLKSLDERITSMAGDLTYSNPHTLGHPSAEAFAQAIKGRATAVTELNNAESLCRRHGLL